MLGKLYSPEILTLTLRQVSVNVLFNNISDQGHLVGLLSKHVLHRQVPQL